MPVNAHVDITALTASEPWQDYIILSLYYPGIDCGIVESLSRASLLPWDTITLTYCKSIFKRCSANKLYIHCMQ